MLSVCHSTHFTLASYIQFSYFQIRLLIFISIASAYITSSSGDVTADAGSEVTLTVTASGDPDDITYEWKKNGVIIPGETSNTLILNDVTPFDIGQYECIPSNSVGSHNSSIIQVDVQCELILKQKVVNSIIYFPDFT